MSKYSLWTLDYWVHTVLSCSLWTLKVYLLMCYSSLILDQVMDSITLVANASCKLNMKWQELIKPNLNPPYTRLCKQDIKPSTKLFGDELSKHLKDMAEAKKIGQQMQRNSNTCTSSRNYLNVGRQKFWCSSFKPHDQKTSHPHNSLASSVMNRTVPPFKMAVNKTLRKKWRHITSTSHFSPAWGEPYPHRLHNPQWPLDPNLTLSKWAFMTP